MNLCSESVREIALLALTEAPGSHSRRWIKGRDVNNVTPGDGRLRICILGSRVALALTHRGICGLRIWTGGRTGLAIQSNKRIERSPAQAGLGVLWLSNHRTDHPVMPKALLYLQLDHILILEHMIAADQLAGEVSAWAPDLGRFQLLLEILVHLARKLCQLDTLLSHKRSS